ncbi:MAG UNVERIFIED_CONTAM: DegT/DnrJ/EryC1/StrS family aminotransferase [Planctomycetaceae bacterium]
MQKCFEYLGYTKGDLPEAELAAEEVLSLPIYSELPADHQRRVVDGLCRAFDLGSSSTVRRIFPRRRRLLTQGRLIPQTAAQNTAFDNSQFITNPGPQNQGCFVPCTRQIAAVLTVLSRVRD